MSSPFPGMDPYIEGWIWGDFHASMISAMRAQLNSTLPKRYIANTVLFIWLEEPDDPHSSITGPDTYVAEQKKGAHSAGGSSVATLTPPLTTVLRRIERKQRSLRIVDSEERRVVTVIELLSPANKTTGRTGEAYRLKRDEYIGNGINLVEIDLLRSGVRPPLGQPMPPVSDYCVVVVRATEPQRLGIWPISVRDALSLIPVPLDPEIPDAVLDLRSSIDRVYNEGRYAEQLDYGIPPKPPLVEPDATWARELLDAHAHATA
jgi:hypothetical protein